MRSRRTFTALALALAFLMAACTSDGGAEKKSGAFGRGKLIHTGAGESYEPKGELIADLGFRPDEHGFGFENYGEGPYQNMNEHDMRTLFGDRVCAYLDGDLCELSPPAAQWMEQVNAAMSGGHCYGFSVSSLLFWSEQQDPADFGGDTTPDIPLEKNTGIQRNIATTWAFQMLPDVKSNAVEGTPNDVLDKLIEVLKPEAEELYTIGIFQADGSGGHAITPFAVEDRGDGTFAVLVYDNNYPKVTRAILFDREANQWGYNAATNPDEPSADYIGDASTGTIMLLPTSPALDENTTCPFCGGEGGSAGYRSLGMMSFGGRVADVEYNQVILAGDPANHGHLLLTAEDGKRSGWVDGKYVNEIPGVIVHKPLMNSLWDLAVEPIYEVPTSIDFDITIDGSDLNEPDMTSVSMIGPGYEVAVEEINLEPGQIDFMKLTPDGKTMSYITESAESPFIDIGIVGDEADYQFAAQGVDLEKGGQITVSLDTKDEILVLVTEGSESAGTYGLGIRRIDDKGEQIFYHDEIELKPGESAAIVFGKWAQDGQGVPMILDTKQGEKTIMLQDKSNEEFE